MPPQTCRTVYPFPHGHGTDVSESTTHPGPHPEARGCIQADRPILFIISTAVDPGGSAGVYPESATDSDGQTNTVLHPQDAGKDQVKS